MTAPAPTSPRQVSPWLLIAGLLLCTLVWIGGVWLWGGLEASPQPLTDHDCVMPDGTILRIEALTVGPSSTLFYRSPAKPRNLSEFLSSLEDWAGGGGTQTLTREAAPRQIVVWMSRRDARTGRPLDFDWWAENVVLDADDREVSDARDEDIPILVGLSPGGGWGQTAHAPPLLADPTDSAWVLHSPLPIFRPKGTRLQFKVRNTAGDTVASFDLPHPDPTPFPEWTAEPLPTTISVGDLAVTLTGLRCGDEQPPAHGWWVEADTTFTWQGKPTTDWEPVSLWFVSPLGTSLKTSRQPFSQPEPGPLRLTTADAAGRRERVWKMSLTCATKPQVALADVERGTLAGIPLQPAGKAVAVDTSAKVNDCLVRVVGVGGSGTSAFELPSPSRAGSGMFGAHHIGLSAFGSSARCTISRTGTAASVQTVAPCPWVVLDAGAAGTHPAARIRAVDDQGREIRAELNGLDHGLVALFMQPEPDATSVTLEIAIPTPVVFETLVELPPPAPAAPAPSTDAPQRR
jgi:hypothetical protein